MVIRQFLKAPCWAVVISASMVLASVDNLSRLKGKAVQDPSPTLPVGRKNDASVITQNYTLANQSKEMHRTHVTVFYSKEELAIFGAKIFRQEVERSLVEDKRLAFVLCTGSTPMLMYQEIWKDWQQSPYNLEAVEFYNSDEYVGLPPTDPHSYAYYFDYYIMRPLLNKKFGIKGQNIHLFKSGKNPDEALVASKERAALLRSRLEDPNWRVVMYGGIGVDPTHVAFNDYRQELEPLPSEEAKEAYALQTETRIVPLDIGTRQANKRFFDHRIDLVPLYAITIGLKEILQADRTIIMANSANKKEAIRKMFAGQPSYKVPASLLRKSAYPLELLLTRNAYTPLDPKDAVVEGLAAVLEASPDRSSYLVRKDQKIPLGAIHSVGFSRNSKVLVLGDDFNSNFASYLTDFLDKDHLFEVSLTPAHGTKKKLGILGRKRVQEGQREDIDEVIKHFQKVAEDQTPSVVILPAQLLSGDLDNRIHLFIQERMTASFTPLIVYYETPLSRIGPYNWLLALTEKDLERQKKAMNMHISQIRRSPVADIPKERAIETLRDFMIVAGKRLRAEYVGLEAYKLCALRNGSFNFNEKSSPGEGLIYDLPMNDRDHLVLVAPHPDDVEIGAAGLLIKAGMQRVPSTVLNATSGSHAEIFVRDALEHPEVKRLGLLKAVAHSKTDTVKDLKVKAQIRFIESSLAIHELNPNASIKSLDLEFYNNGYVISEADNRVVFENLEAAFKSCTGRLIVAMPVAADKHLCHRRTTEVFLDQVQALSRQHPERKILVIYYRTPWTGSTNLYMYTEKGPDALASEALIASELLIGHAGSGLAVKRQIKLDYAWAMRVRDF